MQAIAIDHHRSDATELVALLASYVAALPAFQRTLSERLMEAARRGDRGGILIWRERAESWGAQVARIRVHTSKRHLDGEERAALLGLVRGAADMLRRWSP